MSLLCSTELVQESQNESLPLIDNDEEIETFSIDPEREERARKKAVDAAKQEKLKKLAQSKMDNRLKSRKDELAPLILEKKRKKAQNFVVDEELDAEIEELENEDEAIEERIELNKKETERVEKEAEKKAAKNEAAAKKRKASKEVRKLAESWKQKRLDALQNFEPPEESPAQTPDQPSSRGQRTKQLYAQFPEWKDNSESYHLPVIPFDCSDLVIPFKLLAMKERAVVKPAELLFLPCTINPETKKVVTVGDFYAQRILHVSGDRECFIVFPDGLSKQIKPSMVPIGKFKNQFIDMKLQFLIPRPEILQAFEVSRWKSSHYLSNDTKQIQGLILSTDAKNIYWDFEYDQETKSLVYTRPKNALDVVIQEEEKDLKEQKIAFSKWLETVPSDAPVFTKMQIAFADLFISSPFCKTVVDVNAFEDIPLYAHLPPKNSYFKLNMNASRTGSVLTVWQGWPQLNELNIQKVLQDKETVSKLQKLFFDILFEGLCSGEEYRYHRFMAWLALNDIYPTWKCGVSYGIIGVQGVLKSRLAHFLTIDVHGTNIALTGQSLSALGVGEKFAYKLWNIKWCNCEEMNFKKHDQEEVKAAITNPENERELKHGNHFSQKEYWSLIFSNNYVLPLEISDRRFGQLYLTPVKLPLAEILDILDDPMVRLGFLAVISGFAVGKKINMDCLFDKKPSLKFYQENPAKKSRQNPGLEMKWTQLVQRQDTTLNPKIAGVLPGITDQIAFNVSAFTEADLKAVIQQLDNRAIVHLVSIALNQLKMDIVNPMSHYLNNMDDQQKSGISLFFGNTRRTQSVYNSDNIHWFGHSHTIPRSGKYFEVRCPWATVPLEELPSHEMNFIKSHYPAPEYANSSSSWDVFEITLKALMEDFNRSLDLYLVAGYAKRRFSPYHSVSEVASDLNAFWSKESSLAGWQISKRFIHKAEMGEKVVGVRKSSKLVKNPLTGSQVVVTSDEPVKADSWQVKYSFFNIEDRDTLELGSEISEAVVTLPNMRDFVRGVGRKIAYSDRLAIFAFKK